MVVVGDKKNQRAKHLEQPCANGAQKKSDQFTRIVFEQFPFPFLSFPFLTNTCAFFPLVERRGEGLLRWRPWIVSGKFEKQVERTVLIEELF